MNQDFVIKKRVQPKLAEGEYGNSGKGLATRWAGYGPKEGANGGRRCSNNLAK